MNMDEHPLADRHRDLMAALESLARVAAHLEADRDEIWRRMRADGVPLRQIALTAGVARPTVYRRTTATPDQGVLWQLGLEEELEDMTPEDWGRLYRLAFCADEVP